jgi:hypothetical protein
MRNPPEEWLFRQELPTNGRGIDQRNGNSARNYPLIEEESTRGMGILLGIIELTGRMGFCQELLAHVKGVYWMNGIPPGIPSSWVFIQDGYIKMPEKSSEGYNSRISIVIPSGLNRECLFKKI